MAALSWLGKVTDALGITDTRAGSRGLKELKKQAQKADERLTADMAPVNQMYQTAMDGRSLDQVLDAYDANMADEKNAGGWQNVQEYLNPMYGRAMRNAADQALGGAGASMQSSAANAAVANAVGNQSTSMWNQAFQQALTDSQNNQSVYINTMKADMMPAMNWMQLNADTAGARYNANMDLANASAATAGRSQGIFANLF